MIDKFRLLFETLESALANTKKDLASALEELPPPKNIPPLDIVLPLLVMIRYHGRQKWARGIVMNML